MSKTAFNLDFSSLLLLTENQDLPGLHLLRHLDDGVVLEEADRRIVGTTLTTLRQDIQTVQAALKDARQLVTALSAHVQILEENSARYKSLLAPIRCLPVEILQNIFLYDSVARRRARHYKNIPSIATKVCRYWRNVTLATPELWTPIRVKIGGRSSTAEGLGLFLERSNPFPISLLLYIESPNRWGKEREVILAKGTPVAIALAQVIIPHLSRLNFISVNPGAERSIAQSFFGCWRSYTPAPGLTSLQSLAVPAPLWHHDSTLSLTNAPNLKRVFIDFEPGSGYARASLKSIPWHTLEVFSGPVNGPQLSSLFSFQSGPLQLLMIRPLDLAVPDWPSPDTASPWNGLQNLTSLALHEFIPPDPSIFFPALPSLRHLSLEPARYQPSSIGSDEAMDARKIIAPFLLVLRKWGRQLVYFRFSFVWWSEEAIPAIRYLQDMIATTPNLEAIALPYGWCTGLDNLLARLPNLAHIEIEPPYTEEAKLEEWTYENLGRLRTLSFRSDCGWEAPVEDEAIERIEKFRLANLKTFHCKGVSIRTNFRFDTPYFIEQGGVFAECHSDNDIRGATG